MIIWVQFFFFQIKNWKIKIDNCFSIFVFFLEIQKWKIKICVSFLFFLEIEKWKSMFHFHFLPDIEKWKKENLCQFSFFNENKLHAFCFVFVLCPVPFVIMSKRFLELNKMAAIESLLDREIVRELVENSHRTFEEISEVLKQSFLINEGLVLKV